MSYQARAEGLWQAILDLNELETAVFCIEDPKIDELRLKLTTLLGDAQFKADEEAWFRDNAKGVSEIPARSDYPKKEWA